MTIMETIRGGRNTAAKREPARAKLLELMESASPETIEHFEEKVRTEHELREAREVIARFKQEALDAAARAQATIKGLTDEVAFLRTEIDKAAIDRDVFHTRAVAAETALINASEIIVKAAERGRRHATANGQDPNPPRGHEGAVDLDEGMKHIAHTFGANNRDDSSDETEAARG